MGIEVPSAAPGSSFTRRLFRSCYRGFAYLARGALDAMYPEACPICGGCPDSDLGDSPIINNSPFCRCCRRELIKNSVPCCVRCALPVGPFVDAAGPCPGCRKGRLGFQQAFALGTYSEPLRELVLHMKQYQGAWLGRWLADLLVEAKPALRELAATHRDMLVVPIPLHWRREWARGYNQADELARCLSRRLRLKFSNALKRVVSTDIIAGLSRSERIKAVRGAFQLRRFARSKIKGRTILLVDDVLTTGATTGAAARVLKRAGAAKVIVAVIARATAQRLVPSQ